MRYGRQKTSPKFGEKIGKLAQLADTATNKGDLEEYRRYREEIEQMLDEVAPPGWFESQAPVYTVTEDVAEKLAAAAPAPGVIIDKPKVHPKAAEARAKHKEKTSGKKKPPSGGSKAAKGGAAPKAEAPEPGGDDGGADAPSV